VEVLVPMQKGPPLLIITPSVRANGPAANDRVVVLFTSAFQGGPGGVAEKSGVQNKLTRVISKPPADPSPRRPTGVADAVADIASRSKQVEAAIPNFT